MKTAVIFPGQGSQKVGMGRDFYESMPGAKALYDSARGVLGFDVAGLSFDGPAEELNRTVNTQPCLLVAGYAAYMALTGEVSGVHVTVAPSVVAGHSLGEYTASVAAGALSFEDALRITRLRGQLMQDAVPEGKGMMAAVLGLEREKLTAACRAVKSGYVEAANYNSPGQIVISGEKQAVEEAIGLMSRAGAKKVVPLPVSVPSHCRLMEGAAQKLSEFLFLEAEIREPSIPIVGNADAILLTTPDGIRASLVNQLSRPVLWEDSLKVMQAFGVDTFIEAGPGKVLSGLVRRTLEGVRVFNVEDRESLEKTLSAL
jgi:[acyl-carrier-protein] S-malonyltransferase